MQENFTSLNLSLDECKEKHICPVCGKETELHSASTKKKPKWKLFCSNKCKYSELGKEITTYIQRESVLKNHPDYEKFIKEVSERQRKALLEKYGVEHPLQIKKSKEKFKQTCMEKYNAENPMKAKECKEKLEQTLIDKYGVKNPLQSKAIYTKMKETVKDKYGVEYISQSQEIKDKIEQTNLERYGTKCLFSDKNYREKCLVKFRQIHWEVFVNSLNQKSIEPLFEKDDYIEQNEKSHHFHCRICDKDFAVEDKNTYPQRIFCPSLSHNNKSYAENEIFEWLKSIGIENIQRNKRDWHKETIYEADIFLPDYNLVIEYNGLYWHSNINKEDDYHYNKWKFFKDINIQCIQIFENEWRDHKDIVKGIILNRLGKSNRLYARECIVKEIPNDEYRLFLEQNHLQGYCSAKVRLGLYYNNELMMCMSFSKSRFNKKYNWENIRTCSKIGYCVIGGFSKLFKNFIENHSGSVVSYIDSRYFNGKGYIDNGFEYAGHSKPNYFYFKNHKFEVYNRIEFQKHKLKEKLEKYDENLTEKENMTLNDYNWIYDCGNDIMTYRKGQIAGQI